ncbi:MAG TPA: hypothetical protein VMH86_06275 [Rhizomicrobium sp.]|nr:hypothetical protein [Rhizomicrobium sp.]
MLTTIAILCGWWLGQLPGLLAFVALIVAFNAISAFDRLQDYLYWKRDWRELGGTVPTWNWRWLTRPSPRTRLLIGLPLWLGWGWYILAHADDPDIGVQVLAFLGVTVLTIVVALYQVGRYFLSRRRPRDIAVSVLLKAPSGSPTPAQASAALPSYCKVLMGLS